MTKLTEEEQEIMAWAADSFKKPWVSLCEVFQRINAGEQLSSSEASVDPFFLPFPVDGRLLYHALKHGGKKAVLGDNGSMLTIVTNTRGNRIIWAAIEQEDDGVYAEFHPLKERLGGDWDKRGAELIFDDDMKGAFDHFAEWIKSQPELEHIDLGILKVANVQFFGAFKEAWENADDGRKLALLGVNAAAAVDKILDEGWVKFQPEINLKKLLDFVAPILGLLSPVNSSVAKALAKMPF